ncbi:MAG: ABC transporter ATP-binding protein [Anaerolineales bacterium]|nr:ABC transporter ATP-binding protein [Anaerolineales bacterium]
MSTVVLETMALSKVYGRRPVVDAINIAAHEGEVFGFLGPNGAGKTTTLGMALGLIHPTSGAVQVLGEWVTPGNTRVLRQVGALVGAPALVPHLTARENLDLMARLSPGVDRRRIADVLDQVGLFEAAGRKVGAFSTGMKQRVGLALALLNRPRFLILDEPTNGLDPAGMREIRQLIRALVAEGTSVLLSSHLLNEVQQVCDRIAVLNRGQVVAQGRVEDLLRSQRSGVRLRVPALDPAIDVLRALPGVHAISIEDGQLLVSGVDNQAVLQHLLHNGIIPTELTAQTGDLESLFMSVTA